MLQNNSSWHGGCVVSLLAQCNLPNCALSVNHRANGANQRQIQQQKVLFHVPELCSSSFQGCRLRSVSWGRITSMISQVSTLSPETAGGVFLTLLRLHEEKIKKIRNNLFVSGFSVWYLIHLSSKYNPPFFYFVVQPQGWVGFFFFFQQSFVYQDLFSTFLAEEEFRVSGVFLE